MDMFNWDVVNTLSCRFINANMTADTEFWSGEFSYLSSDGNSITGEFLPWQIYPGGSNSHLRFIAPIKSGTLKYSFMGDQYSEEMLPVIIEFDANLKFVDIGNARRLVLTFDFRELSEVKGETTDIDDGTLTIINSDLSDLYLAADKTIPDIYATYISEMLVVTQEYLYPLASVYFNIPTNNRFSWLNCSNPKYCYTETGASEGNPGFLAVLGILDKNPSPPNDTLPLVFDPSLTTTDAGFAIAKWAFVKHILLPGMPRLLPGSETSQYKINRSGEIVNHRFVLLLGLAEVFPDYDKFTTAPYDVPFFNKLNIRTEGSFIFVTDAEGAEKTWIVCVAYGTDVFPAFGRIDITYNAKFAVKLHKPGFQPRIYLTPEITPVVNYINEKENHSGYGCGAALSDKLDDYGEDFVRESWRLFNSSVMLDIFPYTSLGNIYYTTCELSDALVLQGEPPIPDNILAITVFSTTILTRLSGNGANTYWVDAYLSSNHKPVSGQKVVIGIAGDGLGNNNGNHELIQSVITNNDGIARIDFYPIIDYDTCITMTVFAYVDGAPTVKDIYRVELCNTLTPPS